MVVGDSTPIMDPNSLPRGQTAHPPGSESHFQYPKLQGPDAPNVIRLLEIEPCSDDETVISCTISQVAFRERPQYEALSYVWGEQPPIREILLNGKHFLVRQNLWDALNFLRHKKKSVRFWIDAISINQDDVPEKNSQVRIMPHIYQRAKTVLIWLGKECVTPNEEVWPSILEHGYWDRVWIVQEIGKARNLELCLAPDVRSWESFITDVEERGPSVGGPMPLQRQLEAKYKDAHTLRRLLEMHEDAICGKPHDQIYGLIGLATDCHGFPVDYAKSLFELWKDTVHWVHEKNVELTLWKTDPNYMSSYEFVDFCRLVRKILGKGGVEKAAQVFLQQHSQRRREHSTIPREASIFRFPVLRLGTILDVGPAPANIIESPEEADKWTAKLQESYTPASRGLINLENDHLINSIFDASEFEVCRIASQLRWPGTCSRDGPDDVHEETGSSRDNNQLRLFSMEAEFRTWRLGLVPSGAAKGDSICRLPYIDGPVVIRRCSPAQLIGMAKFAADAFPNRSLLYPKGGPKQSEPNKRLVEGMLQVPNVYVPRGEVLDLDVETLYTLACAPPSGSGNSTT